MVQLVRLGCRARIRGTTSGKDSARPLAYRGPASAAGVPH